jgi:NADH-quinone oxidoreductase subunit G
VSTIPQVKVTIDGQTLEVPQGVMIIEAADNNNIVIPRFCYHKKLTVAANCRMCLVEVEKSRKPLPACATPVADGMVVQTKSPKALAYQKAVMEFLLINHPLDCPICDQGGECELQDLSMGYGKDVSRYNKGKRSVADKDIGPLVETDLTRCIQCTRCVRFGAEVAGMRELGMIQRGEHEEIATFLNQSVNSELSGNIIDLCPVGALTNKPFRYQARAWELSQQPVIAAHDCVGSHMHLHVRRGEAMRSVPRENEAINEVWLSDRDRYGVHAFNVPERATKPMIKSKGQWTEVDWVTAFEVAAKKLKTLQKKDPSQIAALASSQSTVEEFYLLQKLMRSLGSPNIDFRGGLTDFAYQNDIGTAPGIDCSFAEINEADTILVIGSLTRKEAPILHHRLRQAALNGAKIFFINPLASNHNFEIAGELVTDYAGMTQSLLRITGAITQKKPLSAHLQGHLTRLEAGKLTKAEQEIVKALLQSETPLIFAGALLLSHPQSSEATGLLIALKEALAAKGGFITPGANYAGGYFAGALPHRGPAGGDVSVHGKTIRELLDPKTKISTYLLLNMEPFHDTVYGSIVNEALKQAELVVAITPFVTDYLKEHSDVILPMNVYAENSGTFVNVAHEWQSWQGAAQPKGEARPAWKILRVLANILSLAGFDYVTSEEVLAELKAHLSRTKTLKPNVRLPEKITVTEGLQRLGPAMMYAGDMITRHSMPLQATMEARSHHFVGVAAAYAEQQGWREGDEITVTQKNAKLKLPLKFLPVPASLVYVAQMPAFTDLGSAFAPIELNKRG